MAILDDLERARDNLKKARKKGDLPMIRLWKRVEESAKRRLDKLMGRK